MNPQEQHPGPAPVQPVHPRAGPAPAPATGPAQHPQQPNNGHQPVAYDQQGRPLYASPGAANQGNLVYMARPIDPIHQPISPRIREWHEESMRKYPFLNLSKGEYVISAVRRHPIGLIRIWFFSLVLIVACMAMYAMFFTTDNAAAGQIFTGDADALNTAATVGLGFMILLIIAGAMAATYVYEQNKFFLTNESVIQEIQTTIFAKHEQTVSLANIEDASFHQNGIIPSLFNYATIRLSTEGDETTYRFSFVSHPKRQVAILNNAVEAFKNGRPVDPDES